MKYGIGDRVQSISTAEVGEILEYELQFRYSLVSDEEGEWNNTYLVQWRTGGCIWMHEDDIELYGGQSDDTSFSSANPHQIGTLSITGYSREREKEEEISKETQLFLLDILINGSLDSGDKSSFLHYVKLKKEFLSGGSK